MASPWRFKAPLAPHGGATRGRAIEFQELVAFCRRAMAARRGVLLVEGIGGVMVPLTTATAARPSSMRIPIILVAGSYVGTSHT